MMGIEASFQAIPEDCELLKRARQDREVAECLGSSVKHLINFNLNSPYITPTDIYVGNAVRELIQLHPGLDKRYLYAPGRYWDMIIYLLSHDRRIGNYESDKSLIRKAIWGSERLHPQAQGGQGNLLGFVPTKDVQEISEFLPTINYIKLKEYYYPSLLEDMQVYKAHSSDGAVVFEHIWSEFVDIRNIYHEAAAHHEAMITSIN